MTAWEHMFCKSCEHHSVEFHHFVAEAFEDTSYDMVTSRVDFDSYFTFCWIINNPVDAINFDRTIFKDETFSYLHQVVFSERFIQSSVIKFLHFMTWVSQCLSEVAVVSEEEQAYGVSVESSNRVDAFLASTFYEFHNCMTFVWVVGCCDDAFRFVEEHVAKFFAVKSFASVNNLICCVDFSTEFCNDYAVHCNSASEDEVVSFAT